MRTLAKNVKETIGQPDSRLDVPWRKAIFASPDRNPRSNPTDGAVSTSGRGAR
jgi:hypothetical protein